MNQSDTPTGTEAAREIELLRAENVILRDIHGLPKGEAGAIVRMLPILESLSAFLAQVAAEQKPLLTQLVAREPSPEGEEVPIVSLWAAFGDGNPIERIDELVKEVAAAERRGAEGSVSSAEPSQATPAATGHVDA